MSIGKFLQVICVWGISFFYLIGGAFCFISGRLTSVMGVFFLVVGIIQVIGILKGTILKYH